MERQGTLLSEAQQQILGNVADPANRNALNLDFDVDREGESLRAHKAASARADSTNLAAINSQVEANTLAIPDARTPEERAELIKMNNALIQSKLAYGATPVQIQQATSVQNKALRDFEYGEAVGSGFLAAEQNPAQALVDVENGNYGHLDKKDQAKILRAATGHMLKAKEEADISALAAGAVAYPGTYDSINKGEIGYQGALDLLNNPETKALGNYALAKIDPRNKNKAITALNKIDPADKLKARNKHFETWRGFLTKGELTSKVGDDALDPKTPLRDMVKFYQDISEDPALTLAQKEAFTLKMGPILEDRMNTQYTNWLPDFKIFGAKTDVDRDVYSTGFNYVIDEISKDKTTDTLDNKIALMDNVMYIAETATFEDAISKEQRTIENIADPTSRKKALDEVGRRAITMFNEQNNPSMAGMEKPPTSVVPRLPKQQPTKDYKDYTYKGRKGVLRVYTDGRREHIE